MKKLRHVADISGVIMPNNWDENGKITEIAIYTNREEVYRVQPSSITHELMNLMHQQVVVKGNIREYPDGNETIAVQKYKVLETVVNEKKTC